MHVLKSLLCRNTMFTHQNRPPGNKEHNTQMHYTIYAKVMSIMPIRTLQICYKVEAMRADKALPDALKTVLSQCTVLNLP